MLTGETRMGPMKVPERDPEPRATAPEGSQMKGDRPDFQSLLATSNEEKRIEHEKETAAAGGDMRIGENKTDKEFRESLEKVTGKRQDKLKNKLEKDDYLNLMVTQLKYQDPTKPMDNQAMAEQLAQFNTVEQLMGVNKTLGEIKGAQNQADVGKLSPYLGRIVEVVGDKVSVHPDHSSTNAVVKLPYAASTVSVQVKNPKGEVVRSIGMGSLPGGTHKIAFDGKDDKGTNLPAGVYSLSVEAQSVDGKPVEARTLMSVKVEGLVDLATGGRLETTTGPVDVKDIVAIRPDEKPGQADAKSVAPSLPSAAPQGNTGVAGGPSPSAPVATSLPGVPAGTVPAVPAGTAPGMPAGLAQALNSVASQAMKAATGDKGAPTPPSVGSQKPLAPKHRPLPEMKAGAS